MLKYFVFCVLLVAPQLASAESIVILKGTEAWFAPSKSAVAVKVDRIIRIMNGGPIQPNGPPPPPDGATLTQISATWVTKVAKYDKRTVHRQGLASLYLLLSEQTKDGLYTNMKQLQVATMTARVALLGPDRPEWEDWGLAVGSYLLDNVDSLEEAAVSYSEIAAGLVVEGEVIGSKIRDWLEKYLEYLAT